MTKDEVIYKTTYFSSKIQIAVNEEDIGNMVKRANEYMLVRIDRWLSE